MCLGLPNSNIDRSVNVVLIIVAVGSIVYYDIQTYILLLLILRIANLIISRGISCKYNTNRLDINFGVYKILIMRKLIGIDNVSYINEDERNEFLLHVMRTHRQ